MITENDSATSPTAQIPGTLVAIRSSTAIAPDAPRVTPAWTASSVAGRTPTARITSPASIRSPVSSTTAVTGSPSTAVTEAPSRSCTPLPRNDSATRWAMSASSGGITCASRSTTVVAIPRLTSCSAISRPMNPAPTITAEVVPVASMWARISRASDGLRTVNTPAAVTPGRSGTIGVTPVASTSTS